MEYLISYLITLRDHHLFGLRANASSEELYGNIRKSKSRHSRNGQIEMDRLMTNIIVTFMTLVVVAF